MRVRHTVGFRLEEHGENLILLRRSRLPAMLAIKALCCGCGGVDKKGQGKNEHEVSGPCCVTRGGHEGAQPFLFPDKARSWPRIAPTGNSGRGPY